MLPQPEGLRIRHVIDVEDFLEGLVQEYDGLDALFVHSVKDREFAQFVLRFGEDFVFGVDVGLEKIGPLLNLLEESENRGGSLVRDEKRVVVMVEFEEEFSGRLL